MAYLMTYGTAAEITVVRRHLGAEDIREALENAPPGIMDERLLERTGRALPGAPDAAPDVREMIVADSFIAATGS